MYLGADISRSQDITRAAAAGQTVLLLCRLPDTTSAIWRYRHESERHHITHKGVITSKFADRFQLDAEGLLIKNVQTTDEGTYTCADHHHRHRRRFRLFVPCELTSYYLLYSDS